MPQKITMNLHNNHHEESMKYLSAYQQIQKVEALKSAKNSSLKTPMIGRIHNIRPGCGSCGR